MEPESVEHYRARARAESEAALNASSAEARHVHAQMAEAYERLAEIAELEQRGELPPGKVTSLAEALRHREQTELGGHKPRKDPPPRSR